MAHGPSRRQERRSQDVWSNNLEEEFIKIRDVVESYPVIAVDTLLPGTVARPIGPYDSYTEYNYKTLKCNVDLTRVIQICLTLYDFGGHRPKGISTWRFNFVFDAGEDQFSLESIDRLRQSCGLDLGKHHSQGIGVDTFGELLMSSGLVLNEEVRWIMHGGANFSEKPPSEGKGANGRAGEPPWITFCGIYNLGYLLQLLTAESLPEKASDFQEIADIFFPCRCNMARHMNQIQTPHPLTNRDPADPQQRPLFCSAQHVLDAYFRLPEAFRKGMFDGTTEYRDALVSDDSPPAISPAPKRVRPHNTQDGPTRRTRRGLRGSGSSRKASRESAVNAHAGADAGGASGATANGTDSMVNGAAKTGGG